jgi:hypothetical protein
VDTGSREENASNKAIEGSMVRSIVSIFLLLVSLVGSASAMDPSAMEETNCLMACDANQEHCGVGQAALRKNYSQAEYSPSREMKSSPSMISRRIARISQTHEGKR